MFNLTAAILIGLLAHTAVQAATTTERPRCENVSTSFSFVLSSFTRVSIHGQANFGEKLIGQIDKSMTSWTS
jgi:hypothetical protein